MTKQAQEQLSPLDYAVTKVTCSKADPLGDIFVPFPVFCPHRNSINNACRLLAATEIKYPPSINRKETPLFRNDDGSPITIAKFRRVFKWMLKALLPEHMRTQFSVHSFRIYLATCLKATGADGLLIQFMVRWQTVQSLRDIVACSRLQRRHG